MVKIYIPLLLLAAILSACAVANPPQTVVGSPTSTATAIPADVTSTLALALPTSTQIPAGDTATLSISPIPTCPCATTPTVTQPSNTTEALIVPTQAAAEAPPKLPPIGDVYAVVGVAMDDVLNLRSQPGAEHSIVGTIPPDATDVQSTGPDENVNGVAWTPVTYQDMTGWINAKFLAKQSGSPDVKLASAAAQAIQALKQQDFNSLAALVGPSGLRFSPYTYVQPEHLSFAQDQVKNLLGDPTIYHWGIFDGSGAPIDLSFKDYYKRFIYDVDFAQPEQVGYDVTLGGGSTINNIADFYPGGQVVEYYFSGFDPKYAGMDWRSLRLVFLPSQDSYYLAGIVHDEWGP